MKLILLDLVDQVGALVAVFGGVLGVLGVLELLRVAWEQHRADVRERGACVRIGVDQARGVVERISGEQIAERRW